MEKNYIVSVVYQKGSSVELVSGMINALSAHEAIGKAVQVQNKLGSILLTSAIICDETKAASFEDKNNQNQ
tara:strand:- start:7 stop:219 length:213 start_codon:yes stop_codon:yes gene_type:complete